MIYDWLVMLLFPIRSTVIEAKRVISRDQDQENESVVISVATFVHTGDGGRLAFVG